MASAVGTITDGASLALSNAPPSLQTLSTNYLDFAAGTDDWAKQYLPEVYEAEVERYGKRTVSGFLAQVGAEEPMASDQVIWSEQGRLHVSKTSIASDVSANTIKFATKHSFRKYDTVVCSVASGNGATSFKGLVTDADADSSGNPGKHMVVVPYNAADIENAVASCDDNTTWHVFCYGSEFKKGDGKRDKVIAPEHKTLSNKPIIIRDQYEISGSDAAQIGWVEVTGESGQTGYLWYLKAEGDVRSRFSDYIEMALVEGETNSSTQLDAALGTGNHGTEGLFSAIKTRGHITTGLDTDDSATHKLTCFDNILKKFDAQGAIEENMMYVNRDVSLAIDDMLAGLAPQVGVGYGIFNNSEDMALNLGFSGFRRGSYDFYKSDWKYLNDATLRGAMKATNTDNIRGTIIPAGTSSVYDEILGKNMRRPFLHVRYRASQADNRKMKSWITGSVGATTSGDDKMEVHYLSERCLVVQGANNFMNIVGANV